MGQKFVITEQERNQIRGLYEQPVSQSGTTQNQQSIESLFTSEELEVIKYSQFYEDQFNGTKKMSTAGYFPFGFSLTIQKNSLPKIYSHWSERNRAGFILPILFDDNSKMNIMIPNGPLPTSILQLFKTKGVKAYKLGKNPEDIFNNDEDKINGFKNAASVVSKINSKNFELAKKYKDDNY